MSALTVLSEELGAAVAAAGSYVVSIRGGGQHGATGVHWRKGVVVAADHSLEPDSDLMVAWPNGGETPATIAGRDPSTDLAILRVAENDAAVADKTGTDGLRIGHVVLAVSRPGREGPAASMGVISALSDSWTTWRGGRVDKFIRADVSLFPGFSGGALVDSQGKVIGINTSGLSRHWSVTLPVTTVDRVADALLAKGRIARGYLGIGLQSVRIPDQIVRALGLAEGGGAIVVAVEPGSPAEKGGLFIGDVLVGLDGAAVTDVEDIHGLLGPERVGQPVKLRIVRAGGPAEVRLVVGERPESDD